jgi:hypothetical protein
MDKKQIVIKNNFFDLFFLFFWFIISWIKSLLLLFNLSKKEKWDNIFLRFLDFILKILPRYFWKNPTWYKLTSFVWNMLKYIFDRKTNYEK